jgi:hypothetical protein
VPHLEMFRPNSALVMEVIPEAEAASRRPRTPSGRGGPILSAVQILGRTFGQRFLPARPLPGFDDAESDDKAEDDDAGDPYPERKLIHDPMSIVECIGIKVSGPNGS